MAGISSQALKPGYAENHKQFNGIEHTTDLDLNQYDAFYRTLDPQIGRFLQIDPKIESTEAWSPYSAMLNNPVRYSDPMGDSTINPQGNDTKGNPTGIINKAPSWLYENHPVKAFLLDASFEILDGVGINSIDNFVARRFDSENNSPGQILTEAGIVIINGASLEGEHIKGGEVKLPSGEIKIPTLTH